MINNKGVITIDYSCRGGGYYEFILQGKPVTATFAYRARDNSTSKVRTLGFRVYRKL